MMYVSREECMVIVLLMNSAVQYAGAGHEMNHEQHEKNCVKVNNSKMGAIIPLS